MDGQIILTAGISFIFFLVAIALIFRVTRQEAAITWMIRAFFMVALATACIRFGYWNLADYVWWAALYGLLTTLFVFGIFSIMEASVTLGIFSAIARARGGITVPALLRQYNTAVIVRKRVLRLLYSGELVYKHGKYSPGHTSYFRLREVILNIFRLAFARS